MLGPLILLLAEVEAAEPPKPPVTAEPATDESCDEARQQGTDTRTITICAQRPQGYRLNPDVMAAKRIKRTGRGAAPKAPENFKQDSCATVGPMGCRGQAIDIPTAAIAAAQMIAKAVNGEDVGKMFQTDKTLSEYELYLLAKAQREAREEEEAAARVRAEVKAKDAADAKPASVADEPR